jgi:predicted lysophospholipase L1 biosynthesis ABC-type transport system permease subunit
MALPHDTTPEARDAQIGVLRRLGAERRTAIAARMSEDARLTTLAGIRARHPEYDAPTARWALFRLLLGDSLFARVWPDAPRIAP